MKQTLLTTALALTFPLCATAQPAGDDIDRDDHIVTKIIDMNDAEYQWDEFKEKKGKALIKNDCIELEAKKEIVSTCTDLPLDMEKDIFNVRLYMIPDKLDNKGHIGFVFDKEDSDNYKMFTLTKKGCELSYVKDGKISSKYRGMYKPFKYNPNLDNDDDLKKNINGSANEDKTALRLPDNTKDLLVLKIARRGKNVTFSINGVELYKGKNIIMSNPTFGYVASEGYKLNGYGLIFTKVETEEIID